MDDDCGFILHACGFVWQQRALLRNTCTVGLVTTVYVLGFAAGPWAWEPAFEYADL